MATGERYAPRRERLTISVSGNQLVSPLVTATTLFERCANLCLGGRSR